MALSRARTHHQRSPAAAGPGRPRADRGLLGVAGWAGVVGPVLFSLTFLAQDVLRRPDYSPVAEPVSALAVGAFGWVQQVNFVVFGLLTLSYAVGLHRALPPTRWGVVGPALMFLSGVCLVLAAVFPLEEDAAGVVQDPGGHAVVGGAFFGSSALALLFLTPRVARSDSWRRLAPWVGVAGACALVAFPVMRLLVIPDGAPLHEWGGVAQRIIVLGFLVPARLALAVQLLSERDAR